MIYTGLSTAALGEFRAIGQRADGAMVITTADIIRDANTFELVECDLGCVHVRKHDAEAWRKERVDERPRGRMPSEPADLGDN